MNKALAALFVLALLAAGATGLWYFYPDALRSLVEYTPLKRTLSSSTPVYQWRDEQGGWQITDEPPQGTPYEVKQYHLDANILPPIQDAVERD